MARTVIDKESEKKSSPALVDILHGFKEPTACVYVITDDEGGAVKIGVSRNPGQRNGSIQIGNANNTAIYWAVRLCRNDAYRVETFIKAKLRGTKYHRRGEWYWLRSSQAVWFITAVVKKLGLKSTPDVVYGLARALPFCEK